MSSYVKLGNKVGVCGESFFYEGNEVAYLINLIQARIA